MLTSAQLCTAADAAPGAPIHDPACALEPATRKKTPARSDARHAKRRGKPRGKGRCDPPAWHGRIPTPSRSFYLRALLVRARLAARLPTVLLCQHTQNVGCSSERFNKRKACGIIDQRHVVRRQRQADGSLGGTATCRKDGARTPA